ncbi:hypothetical protein FIU97_19310 (plasmid) [Roseivivax sp. THAF40]|nr:hypothetical protein FIV09_18525 [Roseivivax sp. THAF197b]QFT48744.1 hypothetical protein FIU97_19310 [Roseivivax sp. THAF40]
MNQPEIAILDLPKSTIDFNPLITPELSRAQAQLFGRAREAGVTLIALSFVFQDNPMDDGPLALNGIVDRVGDNYQILRVCDMPQGLVEPWHDVQSLFDDPRHAFEFVKGLDLLIAAFLNWGFEVTIGQAYLTPVSLSLLPIHGWVEPGCADHATICRKEAYHCMAHPDDVSQKRFLQTRGQDLSDFLNLLSHPKSNFKATLKTAQRAISEDRQRQHAEWHETRSARFQEMFDSLG